MGYQTAIHGQKSYNGVAILSRLPIEDISMGLPGDDTDEQARYIEATIGGLRVASIYLPNGNPTDSDKFPYKLAWMERLRRHAQNLLAFEEPLVLAGDYNCIPRDSDCWDIAEWESDALALPQTRAAFRALKWLGLTEAFEQLDGRGHQYTFFDYQAGRWNKGHGIRTDHLLCSPQAADRLEGIEIHTKTRGKEKASDHIPIVGSFSL